MKNRADAIIVAAGKGERAKLNTFKQFFEVKGKPVLFYTLDTFCKCDFIGNIIVLLPHDDFEVHMQFMKRFIYSNKITYMRGGKTRMESVYNGLCALRNVENNPIVCIHDGVRPFVTREIIANSIDCAEKYGAALTAVNITDTVKLVEDGVVKSTYDRNKLFSAQTPQTFDFNLIMNAYSKAVCDGAEFTDDCAVAEYCGISVHITEGSRKNIKLTSHEDFEGLTF